MSLDDELKKEIERLGADLFGVADLRYLRGYQTYPEGLLDKYTRGISIALKLPDDVFELFPNREFYGRVYDVSTRMLDDIAFKLSAFIERRGYRALPIPASKSLKKTHWRSFISHKAIARAAGVGWIGKSSLLITPEYGPRVRLVSILTDMPLSTGVPMKSRCGRCRACVESCPSGAIKDSNFEDYPESRDAVFDVDKCVEETGKYLEDVDVGARVCGVCIKVCPVGRSSVMLTSSRKQS